MFYKILKLVVRLVLKIFYRNITIKGEKFVTDKPVTLLSNHRDGIVDALLFIAYFPGRCYFTGAADGPFFKWPLKIFTKLVGIIPMYRSKKGGDPKDNLKSFEEIAKVFSSGGAVVFFPPGENDGLRRVNDFKSGFARASLGAELNRNFELGAVVQPVGINFGQIESFRSSVTIVIGEPVTIPTDVKELAKQDFFSAARILTDFVQEKVKEITVEVEDLEHKVLIEKISVLFEQDYPDDVARIKLITEKVMKIVPQNPQIAYKIGTMLEEYLQGMIEVGASAGDEVKYKKNRPGLIFGSLLIGFGIALTRIPYSLVGILVKKFCVDKYYLQTMKLGLGFFIFSAWYLGLAIICGMLIPNAYFAVAIWLLCVGAGYSANRWGSRFWLLYVSWFTIQGRKRLKTIEERGEMLRKQLLSYLDDSEEKQTS